MRKASILLALIVCLVFAASAQAAEAKFGFFNMAEIANQTDAYKAKLAELEKEFEKEANILKKLGDDLQKKANDFQVQQQALTPEARADRGEALNREKRDLDDRAQTHMRKLQVAERRAQEEILRILAYSAGEVGKRGKYSAVFEQSQAGVIIIDPKFDLSKEILQEANKVWKEKPAELFGGGKK